MLFIRLILASFILIAINEGVNDDWKLRREDKGVSVFTRNVAGSPFEEFKAVVEIRNTTLTRVLDVIMDVKNYPVNFPNCGGAEVLEQKSKYDDIHYLIIDAPWPVMDRDAIYEATTTFSPDGKQAKVKLTPRGDYKEEKKEYVRVQNGSGFWELEEIAPGTIKVIYQLHPDPAGYIPAWIANAVIVSNPMQTLKSLRNLTERM
jgi:hypothetical protein